MRKLAIALLLLTPMLANAATPLVAEGPVLTLQSLGDKAEPGYVCLLGNAYNNNAAGYYTLYSGNESYAVLIDPTTCPVCNVGFSVVRARILLRLAAGANFGVAAGLNEALNVGGCYYPGAELAATLPGIISGISTAGGYYINLTWNSPCATPNEPYFLVFKFTNVGTGVLGPYVDNDGALPCFVYRDTGTGWMDLSASMIGDVFLWAEVDCCEPPVATENDSWSALKNLYR